MPYSRTGEGLHRFVDPVDGRIYLYIQFEVPDARRVFGCFEQPDLKAVFTITVTAPEALDDRVDGPAIARRRDLGDGKGMNPVHRDACGCRRTHRADRG